MSHVDFPGGVVRMEPPHVMLGGDEEECHSNESGWTMYIGSPRDEDAQHCDDDDGLEDYYDYDEAAAQQADPDIESDDSMASDASSGPSHYGTINPLGRSSSSGYGGFTHFQQKEQVKCCSDHKRTTSKGNHQVVEKKNEIMAFTNSKGKAPAVHQNGSNQVKVNKNYKVGRTRKS